MWNFGPILPHKQGSSSEVIQKLFIAVLYHQTKTKSMQTMIDAWTQAPQHAFGCSITKQISVIVCIQTGSYSVSSRAAFDPE